MNDTHIFLLFLSYIAVSLISYRAGNNYESVCFPIYWLMIISFGFLAFVSIVSVIVKTF